jgi:predicted transcriptional regulator
MGRQKGAAMAKTKPTPPSEAESEILQIVWGEQPCSVRTVHEAIRVHRDVGYTTVLKQLQRMQDKGLVAREPGPGKTFLYRATRPAAETRTTLLDRLTRVMFGNSTNELVMHALGRKEVSAEDIDEIKSFIAELEANREGKPDAD